MLPRFRFRANHATVVAYLALFVALGGGAYAAATIDGASIKKNSTPGNRLKKRTVTGDRLKNDTITGRQLRESSLGAVPNAKRLAGKSPAAFGSGVVNGSLYNVPNGTAMVQPYGFYNFKSADFFAIDAVAPVRLTLRDFVGNLEVMNSGSVAYSLYVISGPNVTVTPLCQISSTVLSCRANGPITIPRDAHYRIQTVGNGLPPSGGTAIGFQYRLTVG